MENQIWYNWQADGFNHALPIGNGQFGAMVYGKTDVEKISLNHDTLWSGYPMEFKRPTAPRAYEKAKQLVLEGRNNEAKSVVVDDFNSYHCRWYLPMGTLYIKTSNNVCDDYKRDLNLNSGVATVQYKNEKREYFVSMCHNAFLGKITSSVKSDYEISLDSLLQRSTKTVDSIFVMQGKCYNDDNTQHEGKIDYDHDTMTFTNALKVVSDGETYYKDDVVLVKNSTYLVIYLACETSYEDFDKMPNREHYNLAKARVQELATKDYEDLKEKHIAEFSSYYNRMSLDLKAETSKEPTDERLKKDVKDKGMYELLFNYGRYLIISSSKKGSQASNLQGIWNEELRASWRSDYTTNINTEMNYWPVLMCNLVDFNYPLIELIKKISITGKQTAKEFYNAQGFVCHHNVDIWGQSIPCGLNASASYIWSFWNGASGWLCEHLFNHYEYTMDMDFLKEIAYPIMKEAAKFYLCILHFDGEHYFVTPSTSPENQFKFEGEENSIAKYTTMTQSIVKELFENCITSCNILNIDEEFKNELKEKSEKLKLFAIGSKGQLLEWDKEYEECEVHHRHISHLYGFFPAQLITPQKNSEFIDAVRKSLEIRGDDGTGWSLGWKVNMWAKLKDGNHALSLVDMQLRVVEESKVGYGGTHGGTYLNLFDAHPPFQIDGNFGVTAGIMQMFLQCEDGIIKILPALPDKLACGEMKNALAKGNICVSIQWENKKATKVVLSSPFSSNIKILVNDEIINVEIKENTIKELCF